MYGHKHEYDTVTQIIYENYNIKRLIGHWYNMSTTTNMISV